MTSSWKDLSNIQQALDQSTNLNKNIVLCSRLLKLTPDDPNPYLTWSLQLLKQKQSNKAKQKFKRAIQMSSTPLSSYNVWLEALYAEREFEDLILFVEKNPDKFSIPYNIENTVGICYLHLGDYKNARKCFEKVIASKADFYLTYWNWALALYLDGKKEETVERLEKIEVIRPLHFTVYQREIAALKEDLKREESQRFEELIVKNIEGFEYILELMRKKQEEGRR